MSKIFIDECHAKNILQRMWAECETEQFCDVVLIAGAEETRILTHRSVLCASSDYFKAMFTPPFKESTEREAKLPNINGETLKSLVKYSYSGRIEIREEIAEELLITADSLLMGAVVNACGNFLAEQLNAANCLGMARLAERHNCESLSKKATQFCMEHFVDLNKTDEFLSLNAEQLGQLLVSDDLRVPAEEDVFESLMSWLEFDPVQREQHKDDLLKLVRMPLMQPSFLIDRVRSVCTSTASLQLYNVATDWHLLPERRTLNKSKSTQPRRVDQYLMGITTENDKLIILYHCPQRLSWMNWLEVLENRSNYSIAVLGDDLFIIGGILNGQYLSAVICLNLKTKTLKNINPLDEFRSDAAVAAFNGFLYVVGGVYHGYTIGYRNSVTKWDPQSNAWSGVAAMSTGRSESGIAILNEKLFVVGGYNGNVLSSVETYDPQANAWTTVASMCEARRYPGIAVVGDVLYAVGGTNSKSIERYNTETNRWTSICSFGQLISGRLCTLFDKKIILLWNGRVEEYSPDTNEWKVIPTIKGLKEVYRIFSFSGELLVSKFV